MPLVDSMHAPMAAPAVLKASLIQAGIDSVAMDLNIEVLVKLKSHPNYQSLKNFFSTQAVADDDVQEISKILFYCADRILDHQPTIIALSLLTSACQNFTMWLCLVLKQLKPDSRIVIGGPGIKDGVSDVRDRFQHNIRELGLVDDVIVGDGDRSLVEYVHGNFDFPGINSPIWQPIDDLDLLPYPDWSDYNFYLYSQSYMPIVDAKGCVRNCEFCDVIEFWEKFRSRRADKIFQEMLHQIEKHKIRNFDLRSSISNGNLKEFKKLLALMYDYNLTKDYRPEQISWNASFIVRQKSQHPESMWEMMGATHATLSLGVESVVPWVRKNLGKHFDNEDIDYHLEMAKKYQVKIVLMIITGYPTETLQDYEYTKQWFKDRQHFNTTISRLFLSPLEILPGTALHRAMDTYKIITIKDDIKHWQTETIPESVRMDYHRDLVRLCREELGFNVDAY